MVDVFREAADHFLQFEPDYCQESALSPIKVSSWNVPHTLAAGAKEGEEDRAVDLAKPHLGRRGVASETSGFRFVDGNPSIRPSCAPSHS